MDRHIALDFANQRASTRLYPADTRFANVNAGKAVWWLEIPRKKLFDGRSPEINLLLADGAGDVHHLRVPKQWLAENLRGFHVREDKDAISLELSTHPHDRFTDVRPRSARVSLARFLVTSYRRR